MAYKKYKNIKYSSGGVVADGGSNNKFRLL